MQNHGLVSIITPSYNSSKFISQTIESILSQTYTNWELLITDDCSVDNTREIVESYQRKDTRIKFFQLKENSGPGIARNHSIEMAKGRFIAFCDSDDQWYPEKLEKQLAFMQEKNCALSYTSYMVCDESNVITSIVVSLSNITYAALKRDNGIGCSTAIFDVDKVGKMYFPDIRKRQDWGLWLNILKKVKVAYGMKEPLALYRIQETSLSSNKLSLIRYNIAVYRQVLKYPLLLAYMTFWIINMPCYFMKKMRLYILNL
mgnify:FL=1